MAGKQGESFRNPMPVDGVMKALTKEGKTVWVLKRTAGMGGGVNPIYVVPDLPNPNTCEYGTYLVINDD